MGHIGDFADSRTDPADWRSAKSAVPSAESRKLTHYRIFGSNSRGMRPSLSPIRDKDLIRQGTELGASSRTRILSATRQHLFATADLCPTVERPHINWDGRLLGCCRNSWGDFGDAFQEGLLNSLNNEKIRYARQMSLGKAPALKGIPCTSRPSCATRKWDQRWLTAEDVAPEHEAGHHKQ